MDKVNNKIHVEANIQKAYTVSKIKEGLPQLRLIFICFIVMYGMFGVLDYITIKHHLETFLIIRFAIVIPIFIVFIALTYTKVIYKIAQNYLMLCLISGGIGIAYMLILYPSNFSYYGGLFMIIFSGYFLLRLDTKYALLGNTIVFLFYVIGYFTVHSYYTLDVLLIAVFFLGANIIGWAGNYQLEKTGVIKYIQSLEIHEKNKLLQKRIHTQHHKLLQIEKAFNSTSDAVSIYDKNGEMVNCNKAYTKILENNGLEDVLIKNGIKNALTGASWEGEIALNLKDDELVYLVHADTLFEEEHVLGVVVTFKDISSRKVAEERIRYIGQHDHLTGLYNRFGLEEAINYLDMTKALPLSVIMVDLNGLKLINDTYGHEIGDLFLKEATTILNKMQREKDIVARWGGDEFLIILPETQVSDAEYIAKNINLESQGVTVENIPISMALGVACMTQLEEDLSVVMRVAEEDMYRQKLTESHSAKSSILNALNKAMEVKSFETEAHTQNMQEAAKLMGEHLGLSASELARLDLLTRLHDIGKINIPPNILGKKGPLNDDEWGIMKKHAEIGYRIAHATEEFSHVALEILSHHERWDGSGYPQGLKGEEIPYLARIATIVDSYEVMKNGRVYKQPMTDEAIKNELIRCSGSQFDPTYVKVFLNVIKELNKEV